MHTKKVGTTGRFGNKYGSRVRNMVAKIEATSRAQHTCPQCLRVTLDRMSAGIWKCKKCKITIAGGAYQPTTTATKIMKGEVEAFAEEVEPVVEAISAIEETQANTEEAKPAKKKVAKAKKAKEVKAESEEIESEAAEE